MSERSAHDRGEHTSEHALELVRVLETACFFQLRDHARLSLV